MDTSIFKITANHLLLLHFFFFITLIHFLYILHWFTRHLYYKIRIIWLNSHLQDWGGRKKKRNESELNVLLDLAERVCFMCSCTLTQTDLFVLRVSEGGGEKALALIKYILFSSFCRSTYSLALIKSILFSSCCRNTHDFPTTLICGENKNSSVVVGAHVRK